MALSSSSDAVDMEKLSIPDMSQGDEKTRISTSREKRPRYPGSNDENSDLEALPQQENDDEEEEDDDEDEGPTVLDRVLSRVTSRSSIDPGPPPDGGWVAWCQCIAGHLVIMNTWGFINSFGVFQSYYRETLGRPPSDISWLGTLPAMLLFFLGAFTGRLCDAGYFRAIFLFGSVLQIVGVFTTSVCTEYWQLLLAQGFCMGIANGCIFCPIISVISTYFVKKRALVLGIAACGSATGGLVFPTIARQLLPKVGFGWTIRVMGFIMLVSIVIANLLVRPRIKPKKSPLLDLKAFKDLDYTFYCCGSFFFFWGIYFAFFYLATFSREVLSPPLSSTDSLNLLLVVNGVGAIGRLAPSYLADFIGPVNVLVPNTIITSAILYCWMAVSTPGGLYAWAVFYGIAAAGVQSLFPAGLSSMTTDMRRMGVRLGMTFTIVSIAVLTGAPIAGAIIDAAGDDVRQGYDGAQAFAGSVLATSCGFLTAAKMVSMRRTKQGWTGRV